MGDPVNNLAKEMIKSWNKMSKDERLLYLDRNDEHDKPSGSVAEAIYELFEVSVDKNINLNDVFKKGENK